MLEFVNGTLVCDIIHNNSVTTHVFCSIGDCTSLYPNCLQITIEFFQLMGSVKLPVLTVCQKHNELLAVHTHISTRPVPVPVLNTPSLFNCIALCISQGV